MTKSLMLLLIVEYLVIGVVALWEHKPWLFLYWVSASLLNLSVIKGMK